MGGTLTSPNKIKDVYTKLVFYENGTFKFDNGTANVNITEATGFNSDITLAGNYDYLTSTGSTITLHQIDLTTDVTGTLPITKGGTGATSASAARGTLGVDPAGTDNSTNVTLAGKDYIIASGTNNQTLTLGTVDISDDTNLVGGTGITLTGDTLSTEDSEINHNNLNNYDSDKHVAHSFVTLTAGAGLTADSGGNIAASRSFDIGAGTGITVNANDVAVNTSVIATKNYVDSQVAAVNSLDEMTDVNISNVQNGNLIKYDTTSSKWVNSNEIDGGQFV
jgi:hypothetical protein